MGTVRNLILFIENQKLSYREFETKAKLSNATISQAAKKGDISAENLKKIVEEFSTDLENAGYAIIDLSPFGKEEMIILNEKEKLTFARLFAVKDEIEPKEEKNTSEQLDSNLINELLKHKNELLNEKERFIQQLEEHKKEWKEQNKELIGIMKAQLNNLSGLVSLAHREILTEVKAGMRWEARRLAEGSESREKQLLAELGTIVGVVHSELLSGNNSAMQDMSDTEKPER